MSCLFDSISYFLVYSSDEVRQKICDYLQENKPIVDGLDTSFILSLDDPNYIRNMRNTSVWGGGIEIQSACNIWDLRIIIHTLMGRRGVIEFIPLNKPYRYTIHLTWNGSHFEPIKVAQDA